ncbi:hypothetical protein C1645_731118 [Glomus cerebriforme]|uniref:Uncharacterized protein n=1 Tax=Glomus cerebriforme TaxID=658196 RepID=A0A397TMB3_9GLOM|nr:hypothetical protein C1645_731118 [Glomus cerebriforme]
MSSGIKKETDVYNSKNGDNLNTSNHEEMVDEKEEVVETTDNKKVKENKRRKHKLGIRNMKEYEKTIRKMVKNGLQRDKFETGKAEKGWTDKHGMKFLKEAVVQEMMKVVYTKK